MVKDGQEMHDIKAASVILGVSEQTIRNMIKDRRLEAIKIGRIWRIRQSWIEKYIKEQKEIQRKENERYGRFETND